MLYNLINLDDEFTGMAQKSVGFTGADLNSTTVAPMVEGGSALDQIQKLTFAVPDLMSTTWIVDMYNQHAWLARDLFFICLLLSAMAWLIGQFGHSRPEDEAYLIARLKRSVIAFVMIWQGIPILMTLLLIDVSLCATFGGATSYTSLMLSGITSPFGVVMVAAYTIGIFAMGVFYVCRYFLIFVSCIIWIYAWLMWIFERTAVSGIYLLLLIIINIFLSTVMTLLFVIGAAMVNNGSGNVLVMWGSDVFGLVVMYAALRVPFLAHKLMKHALVRRSVYALSRAV